LKELRKRERFEIESQLAILVATRETKNRKLQVKKLSDGDNIEEEIIKQMSNLIPPPVEGSPLPEVNHA
jgi:hypothetical protein